MSGLPEGGLARLDRQRLTLVAREIMLASHLQDRAGIPAVLTNHPMEVAWDVSIDEWMVTSPVYSRRMQRLMHFEGTGLSTIFKNLQLDMGFPHQFFQVGYRLHDEENGEFWLSSCGALMDVRPMGHEMVKGMCHDIEDPTFDATAVASNRRAQIRPLHRPPEVPHGGPDCHWTVTIRPEHPEADDHPDLARMFATNLAAMPNDPPPSDEPGGWEDYSGAFDPAFELEDLSQRALALVATEFALQGHMLARGCMWSVEKRFGTDEALEVGRQIFTGVGWVGAERLVPALGIADDGPGAIADVLRTSQVLLLRDYLGIDVAMPDDETVRITLAADSPALAEDDPYSVAGLLDLGAVEILESVVHGVNPLASVTEVDAPAGVRAAWDVRIDRDEPAGEPPPVQVTRLSHGATQVFVRRRPLRT